MLGVRYMLQRIRQRHDVCTMIAKGESFSEIRHDFDAGELLKVYPDVSKSFEEASELQFACAQIHKGLSCYAGRKPLLEKSVVSLPPISPPHPVSITYNSKTCQKLNAGPRQPTAISISKRARLEIEIAVG